MKDDLIENFCVGSVFFACLFFIVFTIFTYFTSYNLFKDEWHCTKSQMIDGKNVDRIECIRYEKVIKNDN